MTLRVVSTAQVSLPWVDACVDVWIDESGDRSSLIVVDIVVDIFSGVTSRLISSTIS